MNPIELADEIERRYRRYLKTSFYFRDPDFRASFEDALAHGHLTKGPYLEATPISKRVRPTKDLLVELADRPLDDGFLKAVDGERLFYVHQAEAIQRMAHGQNVVVATGTGSGKTECFLYPILLHLYREFTTGQLGPGIRALVLYPMNALANDQRERFGEICRRLADNGSSFRFTFGQYTGETPEDERDSRRYARDRLSARLAGELVLRSEMRASPPHILLTNFSMLEYLLLRPDDSPLFDNGRAKWWTFFVLDEAHQYRGSRGSEMAMLLRRLKQRLRRGGRSGPFRCIATSATLGAGQKDAPAVAAFAAALFDEPVHSEDVILGETVSVPDSGVKDLPPRAYTVLTAILTGQQRSNGIIAEFAAGLGVRLTDAGSVDEQITELLKRDARVTRLRRLIAGRPTEVKRIAAELFGDLPESERVQSLSTLIGLLVHAHDPETDAPLLSARYHLFLRALEGAFVSYRPSKRVFLSRRATNQDGAIFEVALCRECGQHYLVGSKNLGEGWWGEATHDPSLLDFGATFLRPLDTIGDDAQVAGLTKDSKYVRLCVSCGMVGRDKLVCGHDDVMLMAKEPAPEDEDRADQIAACGACRYTAAGRDPVREVIHGTDGPNAVVATTLFQLLPAERRKILAFADGRQEAAFFAWYLEDSYARILSRHLILEAVRRLARQANAGLSLKDLANELRAIYRQRAVLPVTASDLEKRRAAWSAVYRELLTDEPRISLEGVGLIRWSIEWPGRCSAADIFRAQPWSMTEQDALDVLFVLLDSLRLDGAVELRADQGATVDWSDLNLNSTQLGVRIGEPKGQRQVRSWDVNARRRIWFLTTLLRHKGVDHSEDLAVDALRRVWDAIKRLDEHAPTSDERLLLNVGDARRLNPDWYRLQPVLDDDMLFKCDVCGRLYGSRNGGVCPRYQCPGTLHSICRKDVERDHYCQLYDEHLPPRLRVEEHTAQLSTDKAQEFQRDFRRGRINVLSCSTTFELGVDLGDLDTIFLRNVPPETFNYAQRVGRAGRRSGYPGFAVTYCRRGPHDLYHFADPLRVLTGVVRPSTVALRNEKIVMRHAVAAILSEFFRRHPERFASVQALFGDLENPDGVTSLSTFIREHRSRLQELLKSIVPPDVTLDIGLSDGSWGARVSGADGRFSLAQSEVSSDYKAVVALRRRSFEVGDDKNVEWAGARSKTIAGEDVASFLSRKAVIPKYGFPVDVVELDTQKTQGRHENTEVSLQRDLTIAVAEFAPTSKLVANKSVWTAYGIKRVAEREWPRKLYKRCALHNFFVTWAHGEDERPGHCCDRLVHGEFIIPQFGFVTGRDRPETPKGRPARVFTTRPYFAGIVGQSRGELSFGPIQVTRASPGQLVVLCEGRRGEGFYICEQCGAGFRRRSRERSHKTPSGVKCTAALRAVALGHEFVTDVVLLQFGVVSPTPTSSVWFAYSLAYSLVEGAADVLGVPSSDLNATILYGTQDAKVRQIVMYDNVPGGAGLVSQLEQKEILRSSLVAAHRRLNGACGCGEDTSCYGCLRNYRNQFAHQYLQRGPAKHYLEALLEGWDP